MFVAATSRCFPDLPLEAALHKLVDLEYSYVELMIHETDGHIKPSEILADLDRAVDALPPDAPHDGGGVQRRSGNARRGALLSPVRRDLQVGEGHRRWSR